jgi:hypothetical protein
MFRLNQNKQKTHPNSFKKLKKYIWVFFRKFRVVSVCCKIDLLFWLFRYRFKTPKQTEIFCFWFYETNQTNVKQILFRFEPKFIFVCFEDIKKISILRIQSRYGIFSKGVKVSQPVFQIRLDPYLPDPDPNMILLFH